MGDVKVTELGLLGVKLLEPAIFPDNRGYSGEMYTKEAYEKAGITDSFVVDYEAYNAKKHTLRGENFLYLPTSTPMPDESMKDIRDISNITLCASERSMFLSREARTSSAVLSSSSPQNVTLRVLPDRS